MRQRAKSCGGAAIDGRRRPARALEASLVTPRHKTTPTLPGRSFAASRVSATLFIVVVSFVYASCNHDSRPGGGGTSSARARARKTAQSQAEEQRARRLTHWETNVDRARD